MQQFPLLGPAQRQICHSPECPCAQVARLSPGEDSSNKRRVEPAESCHALEVAQSCDGHRSDLILAHRDKIIARGKGPSQKLDEPLITRRRLGICRLKSQAGFVTITRLIGWDMERRLQLLAGSEPSESQHLARVEHDADALSVHFDPQFKLLQKGASLGD